MTMASSSGGTSLRRVLGGSTSWRTMALRTSPTVSPSKGGWPVSICQNTTPSDQMSVRASTFFELPTCSGDMYIGEPSSERVSVTAGSRPKGSSTLAMPKSSTLTRSCPLAVRVSIMLEGLMSRWTMPCRCATDSATHTCMQMETARGMAMGPSSMRSLMHCPAMKSITM